jgi:phosphoribosyl-AMP cyclohydrolase
VSKTFPAELEQRLNAGELVAAIAQDVESHEVLMLAWMNKESLELTLATRMATYWSRSRKTLWKKGESSGHFQEVQSISFDCDGDALLLLVKQTGAACHTGEHTCFHRELNI